MRKKTQKQKIGTSECSKKGHKWYIFSFPNPKFWEGKNITEPTVYKCKLCGTKR